MALWCHCAFAQVANQLITKSANGRYLLNSVTNQPVYLTADSPQLMATMLCAADRDTYLNDRQAKGFNAIWFIAVDNVFSSNPPRNCNNDLPFSGANFTNFNAAYWNYVDSIVSGASARGMTVIFHVAFVGQNSANGYFTDFNNAALGSTFTAYGTFLGNRYKNFNNIIWLLGGDADLSVANVNTNIGLLATAIRAADANHLITFEACRSVCSSGSNKSSITAFGGSPPSWLDLNWSYDVQTNVVAGCQLTYSQSSTILPLEGEDWYEGEHAMTPFNTRQQGYWATLSGCFLGRIFGNFVMWPFNSVNSGAPSSPTWQSQLIAGGSVGEQYLGNLMRSREHWLMVPDITHTYLTANFGAGGTLSVLSRSSDGQTMIAYLSDGSATAKTINMAGITSASSLVKSWWYNPQTGAATYIGTFANTGTRNFTAPDANDWALVLDDASANLAPPGQAGVPSFLDPSRAIDWTGAGSSVPAYSAACATQPSLLTGSGNEATNATAINNALASCDATHNVVSIPAGAYRVANATFGTQGKQVLRGAGASLTTVTLTAAVSCAGATATGVCMNSSPWTFSGNANVLPPSGSQQCTWSSGYAQGSSTLSLTACGGTPPIGQTLILDQANDATETNGVKTCDASANPGCTYEAGGPNVNGRIIGGLHYSTQQVVTITGVSPLGVGNYSVTISPGVYSTNIRSSQNPGAWWPGFVQNDGIENMTLDGSAITANTTLQIFNCYKCWVSGVRFLNGARSSIWIDQSTKGVIRNNYFYGAQSHAATSYNIEPDTASDFLIENNIFQQTTTPTTYNGGVMGFVYDYNYAINQIFGPGTYTWGVYASHSADDNFNLFEGNIGSTLIEDNASGPANQNTFYRNLATGLQPGTVNTTNPFLFRANNRTSNIIGNVLGTAGYHTQYSLFATSATTLSGSAGTETSSIYSLGGGGTGMTCANTPGSSTVCDPLTNSTLMRWGNYDVINGTRWNSTEAAPAAVPFVNANFTTSYFSTLPQTLPSSLFYSAKPSFFPSGKAWPLIGPDVSTGNVGTCSGGTYSGWLATSSSQCTGGTFATAWASHVISNLAMDCYLNTMSGPPNGSGAVRTFDANSCYSIVLPPAPTGLTSVVH